MTVSVRRDFLNLVPIAKYVIELLLNADLGIAAKRNHANHHPREQVLSAFMHWTCD